MSDVASLKERVPITGYEGLYWITRAGEIFNVMRKGCHGPKRIICTNRYGYPYVALTKGGKRKSYTIHRLLALHFIPNPDELPQVNHVNGVKTDNRLENLEWCTASYNNAHAYAIGLKKPAGVAA